MTKKICSATAGTKPLLPSASEWKIAKHNLAIKLGDPNFDGKIRRKEVAGLEHSFIWIKETASLIALARDAYLGKGGHGKVKLGIDETGKEYAIKIHTYVEDNLFKKTIKECCVREQFILHELGKFLGALQRKSKTLYAGSKSTDEIKHYQLLEYYKEDLIALEFRIKKSKMTTLQKTQAILTVAIKLLKAAEDLHAKGIIHCDFKPSNFMVDYSADENIIAIDFGLASKIDNGDPDLKVKKEPMGTAGYIAPEIAKHFSFSRQSDIYALAITLEKLKITHPLITQMQTDGPSLRPELSTLIGVFYVNLLTCTEDGIEKLRLSEDIKRYSHDPAVVQEIINLCNNLDFEVLQTLIENTEVNLAAIETAASKDITADKANLIKKAMRAKHAATEVETSNVADTELDQQFIPHKDREFSLSSATPNLAEGILSPSPMTPGFRSALAVISPYSPSNTRSPFLTSPSSATPMVVFK